MSKSNTKMPIGKLQRKPSSETLANLGMDSTIDSRMSSTEIPKMELLKVNYVHQCKEAMMHNPNDALQQRHSAMPTYKFAAYKRTPASTTHTQQANVSKITVGSGTNANTNNNNNKSTTTINAQARQPLPPPTIESWQFLQNQKKSSTHMTKPTTTTKFRIQKTVKDDDDDDNHSVHSCCHSSCSDTDSDSNSETTMSPDYPEKSNSWNYRSKVSTRDIRRDLARVGIKSRADRIARIENTECAHKQPTAVAKINQMFEQAAAANQCYQSAQNSRHTTPPQPRRPAPIPIKEPNLRNRAFSPPNLASEERIKRIKDAKTSECCDCSHASSSPDEPPDISKRTSSLGNRYRAESNTTKQTTSRIPKPIQQQDSRNPPTASNMLYNEANEILQRRIKQIFLDDAQQQFKTQKSAVAVVAESTASPKIERRKAMAPQPPAPPAQPAASKEVVVHNTRLLLPTTSNMQKAKVERIHIRKKRQPLLIINQLSSQANDTQRLPTSSVEIKPTVAASTTSGRTCGYKNCNVINCPMSGNHQQHADHELTNDQKRLSLESCSDSGISSSTDAKEQSTSKQLAKLKNLEKCNDCVKVLQATKYEENLHDFDKLTGTKNDLSSKESGKQVKSSSTNGQIKIHVACKPNADPNDVQNFSKKNLTKATTDELLTAAMNNSISKLGKSKQCNIENDLKNHEQRKLKNLKLKQHACNANTSTTTIKIDDSWVQETASLDDDFLDTDSLMLPLGNASDMRKPINANQDNSVKIFVRSSAATTNNARASSVSANSFVSQHSVNSVASTATTNTDSSTSGCSGSMLDNQSDSVCCAHLTKTPCGMYLNRRASASITTLDSCLTCRSPTTTRNSSPCTSAATTSTTTTPITTNDGSCCNSVGGVFWNNAYGANDVNDSDDEQHCCCSLSSCDDDNCSYYEQNDMHNVIVVESAPLPAQTTLAAAAAAAAKPTTTARASLPVKSKHAMPMDTHQFQLQQLQQREHERLYKRNSYAEDQILRNHKLLRKTDVIPDLRPRSMDGVVDSGVSLNGDNGSSPDGSEHMQNQQDSEARRLKRGHVLSELLETERIYVNEMSSILKGYYDQMQSEEMMHLVPPSLQGKEDVLFGNLHELYTFHNEVFLKDLENCISTTELVALCFVQRRDTFYRLYSFYCQNIPRSERLRETLVDTHLFLQECQKRLGHKLPLGAYLLKPVQRITKYQLLLKDLLRFSDSGSCTKELQKALDCMLIVLKCVNDSMHQVAITGFPSDLAQQGELLLQDSFQVWTESKKDMRLRIKPQQRHIFLYQKSMLFCKQTSKPGHNKSTYQFKHHVKMSQIGLTESVRGDNKRFEVWLQGRQEVHTMQAPTIEIKNKWVAEVKRVLLNQLEELKGEKIKQYGLNHRGLRQTTSWDTPNILFGTPSRTISCDASSESSNRNSNCSSSGDDNCGTSCISGNSINSANAIGQLNATTTTTATATTIDKEQQQAEACGWSSDYSNSEDELSLMEDNSTPGSKYIALADYTAMGHSEVSIHEGDTIELLKVGCAGWWYVRILDASAEGWTPAAYLESLNRKSSRSSSRNQERLNFNKIND